jgi:hypothetical protein
MVKRYCSTCIEGKVLIPEKIKIFIFQCNQCSSG